MFLARAINPLDMIVLRGMRIGDSRARRVSCASPFPQPLHGWREFELALAMGARRNPPTGAPSSLFVTACTPHGQSTGGSRGDGRNPLAKKSPQDQVPEFNPKRLNSGWES